MHPYNSRVSDSVQYVFPGKLCVGQVAFQLALQYFLT